MDYDKEMMKLVVEDIVSLLNMFASGYIEQDTNDDWEWEDETSTKDKK